MLFSTERDRLDEEQILNVQNHDHSHKAEMVSHSRQNRKANIAAELVLHPQEQNVVPRSRLDMFRYYIDHSRKAKNPWLLATEHAR